MGQGSKTLAGAGAAPQDNPPRQQPTEDGSSNQERGGGKGNVLVASPVCIYSARGGAPAALPLLSLVIMLHLGVVLQHNYSA